MIYLYKKVSAGGTVGSKVGQVWRPS